VVLIALGVMKTSYMPQTPLLSRCVPKMELEVVHAISQYRANQNLCCNFGRKEELSTIIYVSYKKPQQQDGVEYW